jgi:hypothetical protein
MKKLLSFAALCMTATLALAQGSPSSMPQGGPNMDRLELLLDLDAGQKVAVEKVLTEQRAAMQAQRKQFKESGERPSHEQMKAQFQAQHAATIEKLRPVLSDVQLKKYEALANHPRGARGWSKYPDASDKSSSQK